MPTTLGNGVERNTGRQIWYAIVYPDPKGPSHIGTISL